MDKEVSSYLDNLFQVKPYSFSSAEHKRIERDKSGFIFDKLTRKKFRRRLGDEASKNLQDKIELSVRENLPVHFCIPFGGYKHYWNTSHPEPDWAEVFHFRYMTDYVLPILSVHRPGVVFEYISEDLILPAMDNYPEAALDAYSVGFKKLIDWYSKHIPNNLGIRYFRIGDRFDKNEIINRVLAMIPERRKAFSKLSSEEQINELHRSARSVFWAGKKDLTGLNEKEKTERIIESRLIELAYYEVEASSEYLGNYYSADNHIDTWFSGGLSADNVGESLSLSTSHGSVVDFWIGRGVLEEHQQEFVPTIISQNQYNSAKDRITQIQLQSSMPLNNLRSIEVLEKEFAAGVKIQ